MRNPRFPAGPPLVAPCPPDRPRDVLRHAMQPQTTSPRARAEQTRESQHSTAPPHRRVAASWFMPPPEVPAGLFAGHSDEDLVQLALAACAAQVAAQAASAEANAAQLRLVQAVVSRKASPAASRQQSPEPSEAGCSRAPSEVDTICSAATGRTPGREEVSHDEWTRVILYWLEQLSTMDTTTDVSVTMRFLLFPRSRTDVSTVLARMQESFRGRRLHSFLAKLVAYVNARLPEGSPNASVQLVELHPNAGKRLGGTVVSQQRIPSVTFKGTASGQVAKSWQDFSRLAAAAALEFKEGGRRLRRSMFGREWQVGCA